MDPWIAAGAVAVPAAGLWAGSWIAEVRGLHDWLVPGAVWRTPHPHAVATFDDGPHPERTPRVLDALAAAGAKAVFFLVGGQAERHPALVRRIAAEGHQVGNHSWSHPWMVWRSRRTIEREFDRTQALLAELAGSPPRHARPPYGQRDARVYRVLRERGLVPVLWSRNLRDYWNPSPERLLARMRRAAAGDILLMHDGDEKAGSLPAALEAWLPTRPVLGLL